MRRLMILAIVILVSMLLALPCLAEQTDNNPRPLPPQAAEVAAHKTEVFKRWQAYVQKREAMKQRREQAMRTRDRLVNSNSPGNTGF